MNYLTDKLPHAVMIDGDAVTINTDFRVCLRIIQAMEDPQLMEHEKLTVLVTLLYPDIPKNTALAIEQGLKFLNMGEKADISRLKQPQVYSLNKDSTYIYTAFKSTFNIDLNTVENLHWWTFRSLFADLGKDCFFNTMTSSLSNTTAAQVRMIYPITAANSLRRTATVTRSSTLTPWNWKTEMHTALALWRQKAPVISVTTCTLRKLTAVRV